MIHLLLEKIFYKMFLAKSIYNDWVMCNSSSQLSSSQEICTLFCVFLAGTHIILFFSLSRCLIRSVGERKKQNVKLRS